MTLYSSVDGYNPNENVILESSDLTKELFSCEAKTHFPSICEKISRLGNSIQTTAAEMERCKNECTAVHFISQYRFPFAVATSVLLASSSVFHFSGVLPEVLQNFIPLLCGLSYIVAGGELSGHNGALLQIEEQMEALGREEKVYRDTVAKLNELTKIKILIEDFQNDPQDVKIKPLFNKLDASLESSSPFPSQGVCYLHLMEALSQIAPSLNTSNQWKNFKNYSYEFRCQNQPWADLQLSTPTDEECLQFFSISQEMQNPSLDAFVNKYFNKFLEERAKELMDMEKIVISS